MCCADWNGQLVIGSILRDSLRDLWQGTRAQEIRDVHLAGRRDTLNACRDCTLIYKQPDDLDFMQGTGESQKDI